MGGTRRRGSLVSSASVNAGSINGPSERDNGKATWLGGSDNSRSSSNGKRKKLPPHIVVGVYLIVVGSLLTRILVDLLDIFPSSAEIFFLALVAITSTLVVMLTAYVSLNIEYQGDKLILANAANGTGLVRAGTGDNSAPPPPPPPPLCRQRVATWQCPHS